MISHRKKHDFTQKKHDFKNGTPVPIGAPNTKTHSLYRSSGVAWLCLHSQPLVRQPAAALEHYLTLLALGLGSGLQAWGLVGACRSGVWGGAWGLGWCLGSGLAAESGLGRRLGLGSASTAGSVSAPGSTFPEILQSTKRSIPLGPRA